MTLTPRHWACALALSAATAVWSQGDTLRSQVEQRVRLTARLIADSPTAQRILASGDRDAINHFDEGRVHQSLAEDRLARDDLAGAKRAVEVALLHISMARRAVPDARARQAAAQQRYEQFYPSVVRLLDAWRARAGAAGAAGAADPELLLADNQVAAARLAQQEGRYEDANQTLAAAERRVLTGINRLLHAATLDYTERAATPAEELAIELSRHQSLTDLVPIALADLRPAPDAVALIERYQDTSRALRTRAEQSAQRGDTGQALAHIRSAVLYVQRALAAAGVSTPTPTGSPP